MNYREKCSCNKCSNSLGIFYSGKFNLNKGKINFQDYHELSELKNLYVSLTLDRDSITKVDDSQSTSYLVFSMEKIPLLIQNLQQAYKEYQEVKEELKKQGKLELLSKEDNLPNLSEQNSPNKS